MTVDADTRHRNGTGVRPAARSALDVMLTEAETEPSGVGRFLRPTAAVRVVGALARKPGRVSTRIGDLGGELARVVAGFHVFHLAGMPSFDPLCKVIEFGEVADWGDTG